MEKVDAVLLKKSKSTIFFCFLLRSFWKNMRESFGHGKDEEMEQSYWIYFLRF